MVETTDSSATRLHCQRNKSPYLISATKAVLASNRQGQAIATWRTCMRLSIMGRILHTVGTLEKPYSLKLRFFRNRWTYRPKGAMVQNRESQKSTSMQACLLPIWYRTTPKTLTANFSRNSSKEFIQPDKRWQKSIGNARKDILLKAHKNTTYFSVHFNFRKNDGLSDVYLRHKRTSEWSTKYEFNWISD